MVIVLKVKLDCLLSVGQTFMLNLHVTKENKCFKNIYIYIYTFRPHYFRHC